MSIETIKDILDWNRRLHQELSRIYRESSEATEDERSRLLLDYIAEHEERLAETIARYEKDDHVEQLDSWTRNYLDKNPFAASMKQMMDFTAMGTEQILQTTVAAHQKLIELYRELAQNAKSERLEELFKNLASLETHELMRMVMSGERWNDM